MLFHISQIKHDEFVQYVPRIPNNWFVTDGFEDGETKRVCFSTSIEGCLSDLQVYSNEEYYVYYVDTEKQENIKVISPSKTQVPDVEYTDEKWCLTPVWMRLFKKIKTTTSELTGFILTGIEDYDPLLVYKWKYETVEKY